MQYFNLLSVSQMRSRIGSMWVYATTRSPRTYQVSAMLLVLAIVGLFFLSGEKTAVVEEEPRARTVSVLSIADIVANTTPLPVVGKVESKSEAELRTETSGRVTNVYYQLGDTVGAGRIIAEIENSAQRAAVTQAEGVLDSAKAALARLENGSRTESQDITKVSAQSAATALSEARSATVNTIATAYNTNDDVIYSKLDTMFSNPRSSVPRLNVQTSDSALKNQVEQQRIVIEQILDAQAARRDRVTATSDLFAELELAQEETRAIRTFVDLLSSALNKGIATQNVTQEEINGYISLASAARSTLATALGTLSGAAQDLNSKATQSAVAERQVNQDTTGRSEEIATAQAALKQAQGAYSAALSALEKTIVRAPIGGTLNSLSISRGDYVSPLQSVAVVSNNNALEILTYVSEDDRNTIAEGTEVRIEQTTGTITKIASAIDPTTKKIEVRIAVADQTTLTNGESVRIEIPRVQTTRTNAARAIAIPVEAIKIEANRAIVFTVSPESTLVAHPIEIGTLLGDKVEVTGISDDTRIVLDVRGLKEGQEVAVQ